MVTAKDCCHNSQLTRENNRKPLNNLGILFIYLNLVLYSVDQVNDTKANRNKKRLCCANRLVLKISIQFLIS